MYRSTYLLYIENAPYTSKTVCLPPEMAVIFDCGKTPKGRHCIMKIKAAVVYAPNTPYVLDEVELAPPEAHEVLVKIAASGICNTDDAAVKHVFSEMPFPVVLGHEGCGTVVDVGRALQISRPATVSACPSATAANAHPAAPAGPTDARGIWSSISAGTLTTAQPVCQRTGRHVATFFEPVFIRRISVVHQNNLIIFRTVFLWRWRRLSAAVYRPARHGAQFLKPGPGSSVVVSGCGAVGMSAVMAAKLCGCSQIIGVDVVVPGSRWPWSLAPPTWSTPEKRIPSPP